MPVTTQEAVVNVPGESWWLVILDEGLTIDSLVTFVLKKYNRGLLRINNRLWPFGKNTKLSYTDGDR